MVEKKEKRNGVAGSNEIKCVENMKVGDLLVEGRADKSV